MTIGELKRAVNTVRADLDHLDLDIEVRTPEGEVYQLDALALAVDTTMCRLLVVCIDGPQLRPLQKASHDTA